MDSALARPTVERFERDGAVLIRNVLSPTWLELIAEGVEFNRRNPSEWSHSCTKPGATVGFWSDYGTWRNVAPYRQVVHESGLAELAGGLMGSDEVRIFHCCGGEATTRRQLAEATVEAFGLDRSLLKFGPAPRAAFAGQTIPFDTSVSAVATSERLGTPLLSLEQLLSAFRYERETNELAPLP